MRNPFRRMALFASCLWCLGSIGCRQSPHPVLPDAVSFPVQGVVLGKSRVNREITLDQTAVPYHMPAGSVVYAVQAESAFQTLQAGDRVRGEAVLPGDGSTYRLRAITILPDRLNSQALLSLPPHRLLAGEAIPAIAMVNQDGKSEDLTEFRGKAVLVTFVDTECTDECPVISRLFAKVDRILAKNPQAYARSRLITVSLNPAHDTPPVLRRYGLRYLRGDARGFSHWQFVTLKPANLHRFAAGFGVTYWASRGDIVHTLDASLIAPDNTLLRSWVGDDWDPAKIAKAMEAAAEARSGREPAQPGA